MKQRQYMLIFLLLLMSLGACSPGHTGENIIGFLRGGQLWTIDPDGANVLALVSGGEPVVGYSWSPDHRLIVFRQLDKTFVNTKAAKQFIGQKVTGQIEDLPATLNTFGVDGGTPITIALSSPDVRYNNPFWINNGTRLLYRQEGLDAPKNLEEVTWWVSQSDQPAGIAAKSLPGLLSLPSVDGSNLRVVGRSHEGIISATLAGTEQSVFLQAPANGNELSASLERVLWQPGQTQGMVLYAVRGGGGAGSSTGAGLQVELRLLRSNGVTRSLLMCACAQFAWSPNGKMILYREGKSFSIYTLKEGSKYSVQAEQGSVPYWSPDSRFLLLDGPHTLQLVEPEKRREKLLLTDGQKNEDRVAEELAAPNALLQPVSNSSWSGDSRQFLFVTQQRLSWQGKSIQGGRGLYTVMLGEDGQVQGEPTLVSKGDVTQAGWTYQNPDTSFLY